MDGACEDTAYESEWMDREELGETGSWRKEEREGGLRRGAEPGVRRTGRETDVSGECDVRKKQRECPTVRVQLPLRQGRDRLSICQ